jgi:hypothetical protein
MICFINLHGSEKWFEKKLKIYLLDLLSPYSFETIDNYIAIKLNVGYNLANTSSGNVEARRDEPKQINSNSKK